MISTPMSGFKLSAISFLPVWLMISELGFAGLIGLGLLLLGADGTAWILGGIAAGAIVFVLGRSRFNLDITPNRSARKIGQMLVGLMVGFSIQHSDVGAIAANIPIFILLTGCLLVGSFAVAGLYVRLQKTDWLTAMLSTTPGNIGVMASIAADYGSNPAIVSLVQLVRFTVVTSTIPLLSHVSHPTNVWDTVNQLTHPLLNTDMSYLARLGLVLFVASLSVQLGGLLRIPVPGLMCPLVVGVGFNALVNTMPFLPTVDFNPPVFLSLLGQILLGTTIGEYWGMNPNLGRGTIVRSTIPGVLTLLVGVGVAALAKLLTSWDWLTCLLVASPGGSPEMIWIALTLNQNVEVVTAGHLVRLITLNILLPVMISLATSLERSRSIIPPWLTDTSRSPSP